MLKPIKTEKQYDDALARIYELMQMDIKEGSKEYYELEKLSIVVEEYEKINCPILQTPNN